MQNKGKNRNKRWIKNMKYGICLSSYSKLHKKVEIIIIFFLNNEKNGGLNLHIYC